MLIFEKRQAFTDMLSSFFFCRPPKLKTDFQFLFSFWIIKILDLQKYQREIRFYILLERLPINIT